MSNGFCGMTHDEYKEYLWGRHWRRLRMKLRRQTEFCELCGLPLPREYGDCLLENWQVHHWTYANVPKEKREDLSVLCEPCHKDAHAVMDGNEPGLVRRMFREGREHLVRIDRAAFVGAVSSKVAATLTQNAELRGDGQAQLDRRPA